MNHQTATREPLTEAECDDYESILANLQHMHAQLEQTAYEQHTSTGGVHVPISVGTLPVNTQAVELLQALESIAIELARLCGDNRFSVWQIIKTYAKKLKNHSSNVIYYPALRSIRAHVKNLSEGRLNRFYVGQCSECNTSMFATDQQKLTTCPKCKNVYNVNEVREYTQHRHQQLLGGITLTGKPTEIARQFTKLTGIPLNTGTLKSWISRGKLHTIKHSARIHEIHATDLLALTQATR